MSMWGYPRVFAGAKVTAATPAFQVNRGFRTIISNGAGDKTLSLETGTGLDTTNSMVLVTMIGVEPVLSSGVSVVQVNDTDFRITTSNGAALADLDFSVVVFSII